jgi:hypothetical protein
MAFTQRSSRVAFVAGLGLLCGAFLAAGPAAARDRVGVLQCNIAPGIGLIVTSNQALSCRFKSVAGWTGYYVGTIRKFGLDIGFTGPQRLIWAVFTATAPDVRHALEGEYVGATAGVSLGAGLGANVLVGGNGRSIALQPLSVSATTGINIAAGVGDLFLEPAHR